MNLLKLSSHLETQIYLNALNGLRTAMQVERNQRLPLDKLKAVRDQIFQAKHNVFVTEILLKDPDAYKWDIQEIPPGSGDILDSASDALGQLDQWIITAKAICKAVRLDAADRAAAQVTS